MLDLITLLTSEKLPKGTNNGNHGIKGLSGRKSAITERVDYDFLERIFFERMGKKEIKKLLESGKYSLSDVFIAKAYGGDIRCLIEIFRKVFPDKKQVEKNFSIEDVMLKVIAEGHKKRRY